MPREFPGLANTTQGAAKEDIPASKAYMRAGFLWAWFLGEWAVWLGIFVLDVCIVIGLQVFLESIGKKRGGASSIMPKKNVASAIAVKVTGGPPGAPIPTPSGTPGPQSTQRLSVLLQEDYLAALLAEHWGKLAIGIGVAVAVRLPIHVLNNDGILCHMLINLAVMLRCMSLVMLLIRDDVALPKREKVPAGMAGGAPGVPPPPPPSLPQEAALSFPTSPEHAAVSAAAASPTSPRLRRTTSSSSPAATSGGAGSGGGGGGGGEG